MAQDLLWQQSRAVISTDLMDRARNDRPSKSRGRARDDTVGELFSFAGRGHPPRPYTAAGTEPNIMMNPSSEHKLVQSGESEPTAVAAIPVISSIRVR
jgi:hypothetical protein